MKDRAGRGTQPGTRCCLQCHTAALGTQCCAMGQGSPGMQQKAVAVGRRSPAPQSSHPAPHRARQPLLSCVWANLSFFFHYPGMQSFLTNMICCLVIRLTFILLLALITAPIPGAAARWYTCQTGRGVAEHPFMPARCWQMQG
mgnify:CR=1 FL=1